MLSNWTLQGRLTKEPEIKSTQSGALIADLQVAITRDYKNKDTNEYESDFFFLQAFGNTAEFIQQYGRKGNLITAQVRPQNNNYEKNGVKVYQNTFRIISIDLFTGNSKNSNDNQEQNTNNNQGNSPYNYVNNGTEITDDDLPF